MGKIRGAPMAMIRVFSGVLVLSALILACSNVPLTSIPRIQAIDLKTTDLSQMSAVAKIPEAADENRFVLQFEVSIENKDTGESEIFTSNLQRYSGDSETQALISEQSETDYQLLAYRIAPTDIAEIDALRDTIADWREAGAEALGKTNFRFLGACYKEGYALDDLKGKLWVRAEETNGYVLILRNVDLSQSALEAETDPSDIFCK